MRGRAVVVFLTSAATSRKSARSPSASRGRPREDGARGLAHARTGVCSRSAGASGENVATIARAGCDRRPPPRLALRAAVPFLQPQPPHPAPNAAPRRASPPPVHECAAAATMLPRAAKTPRPRTGAAEADERRRRRSSPRTRRPRTSRPSSPRSSTAAQTEDLVHALSGDDHHHDRSSPTSR